jgi:hypothetical protein
MYVASPDPLKVRMVFTVPVRRDDDPENDPDVYSITVVM